MPQTKTVQQVLLTESSIRAMRSSSPSHKLLLQSNERKALGSPCPEASVHLRACVSSAELSLLTHLAA